MRFICESQPFYNVVDARVKCTIVIITVTVHSLDFWRSNCSEHIFVLLLNVACVLVRDTRDILASSKSYFVRLTDMPIISTELRRFILSTWNEREFCVESPFQSLSQSNGFKTTRTRIHRSACARPSLTHSEWYNSFGTKCSFANNHTMNVISTLNSVEQTKDPIKPYSSRLFRNYGYSFSSLAGHTHIQSMKKATVFPDPSPCLPSLKQIL